MNTKTIKHEGEINLVGVKMPCYVLEDGTRVLSVPETQEVLKKLGSGYSKQKPTNWYKQYLKKKPQISFIHNKKEIIGLEATMLEDLFNVYLEVIKGSAKLSPKQRVVANQCEMLLRSFAKVGIISLIDEATGYQQTREDPELQKVLKTYTLSPRAFKLISENKEEFLKYLKENHPADDLDNEGKVSKEKFDEALKVLLNTPPRKKK